MCVCGRNQEEEEGEELVLSLGRDGAAVFLCRASEETSDSFHSQSDSLFRLSIVHL